MNHIQNYGMTNYQLNFCNAPERALTNELVHKKGIDPTQIIKEKFNSMNNESRTFNKIEKDSRDLIDIRKKALFAKVNSLEELPEYCIRYAEENNLHIALMGDQQ